MQKKQCTIFGERLKKLRNKRGLTQVDLSETLKIQRVTIAKYEKGDRAPTIDHLLAFADFFQVSTDYLLNRSVIDELNAEGKSYIAEQTGMTKEMIDKLMIMKQEKCTLMLDTVNMLFNHDNYLKIISELIRLQAVCSDLSEYPPEYLGFDIEMQEFNNECILHNYQLSVLFKEIVDSFDTRVNKKDFFYADANGKLYGSNTAKMVDEFHVFHIKMHEMGYDITKEEFDNGNDNPKEE